MLSEAPLPDADEPGDEFFVAEPAGGYGFARDYSDLRAYHLAFETTMRIFALSRDWPAEERYALTDQIRRSSRSVCGNIAEAWRKRRFPKHFVSKLSDADAEAAETENWLRFAHACGYIDHDTYQQLLDHCNHACRMLTNMMAHPDKWCK